MEQITGEGVEQAPRRRGRPRTRGITTQMNVRVDKDLKVRGDEVLRSMGSNPTDVISRLWSYVVRTGRVPDFLTDEEREAQAREEDRLNREIEDARGRAWRMLADEAGVAEGAGRSLSVADLQVLCTAGSARRAKEVAQS